MLGFNNRSIKENMNQFEEPNPCSIKITLYFYKVALKNTKTF